MKNQVINNMIMTILKKQYPVKIFFVTNMLITNCYIIQIYLYKSHLKLDNE